MKSSRDCNNSLLVRGDHVAFAAPDYLESQGHVAVLRQGIVTNFYGTDIGIAQVGHETEDRVFRYNVIKVTA